MERTTYGCRGKTLVLEPVPLDLVIIITLLPNTEISVLRRCQCRFFTAISAEATDGMIFSLAGLVLRMVELVVAPLSLTEFCVATTVSLCPCPSAAAHYGIVGRNASTMGVRGILHTL